MGFWKFLTLVVDEILLGGLLGSPFCWATPNSNAVILNKILDHHPTFGCIEFHVTIGASGSSRDFMDFASFVSWRFKSLRFGDMFGVFVGEIPTTKIEKG